MKTIIGLLTIIGFVFGAYFWIDGRYASSEMVAQIQQRLDYKINKDQFDSVQDRIWRIMDRSGGKEPTDPTVKEELRKLRVTLDDLRRQLEGMEKKGK